MYEKAIQKTLEHEGGYTNNPKDPGGETNFGITQKELTRVHESLGLPSSVKELTKENAKTYYKKEWWDKYHYESIKSSKIATKLFDMAVNLGASKSTQIAQQSCNSFWFYNLLVVDGIIGSKTIKVINGIVLAGLEQVLMNAIINKQKLFYEHLVDQKPNLKIFLKGWLNRADYQGT